MRMPRVRFRLWRFMIAVALVACAIGAAVAFSVEPNTASNVLTGWAALYAVPLLMIFARGASLKSAAAVSGKIILFGLPGACLLGLISFAMSGYVGLVGGSALGVLVIGWAALLAAALSADKPVILEEVR